MIVTLLRHGSTAWNELGRMQGRRDIPLSERGRAQVRGWRLPGEFAHPSTHWLASPLGRAAETARILAGREPTIEPALVEMDWGDWEGYELAELRARFGSDYARNEAQGLDFRPPGGESPREVLARVRSWLSTLGQSEFPLIAITHLGVLRALLAGATGWDMTGKPPIRLLPDTLHRFSIDRNGALAIAAANVSLVAAT